MGKGVTILKEELAALRDLLIGRICPENLDFFSEELI
jgi:hypothetical protein